MSVDQMVIHHLTNEQLFDRHFINTQLNKKLIDFQPNDGITEVSLTKYCLGQMLVDQMVIHHLTDQQLSDRTHSIIRKLPTVDQMTGP
jgi:hypothetical protein